MVQVDDLKKIVHQDDGQEDHVEVRLQVALAVQKPAQPFQPMVCACTVREYAYALHRFWIPTCTSDSSKVAGEHHTAFDHSSQEHAKYQPQLTYISWECTLLQ